MHGIIKLFDGRHVDLARILEVGAPVVDQDKLGFDITYMLQDRPHRTAYSIKTLVGEDAYIKHPNSELIGAAKVVLEKHIADLIAKWTSFRKEEAAALLQAKTDRPYGSLEIGI